MTLAERTIAIAPVVKTVQVKASQTHAFQVFTTRFSTWWPATHHIGKAPMVNAVIEPKMDGRWYEVGDDGSECDWGRVLAWEPPGRLVLSWHLDGDFQFRTDTYSEVEVTFTPLDDSLTRVTLEHRNLDRFGQDNGQRLRGKVDSAGGWTGILDLYATAANG
ncbi:SRPBCC family protein [Azospirillum sp. B4]|uniref:SRPBCC family protein n=1 Tax=Azospirillum sp. B4 TaxID=95605 RepID=UPI00034D0013|nr:SRPBCC family protein [Azospirillum sp. B4]